MKNLFLDIETVPEYSSAEYRQAKEKYGKIEDEFLKVKNELRQGRFSKDEANLRFNEIKKGIRENGFWKFFRGALNPFEGKVVVIAFQVDNEEMQILCEWESSEKEILQRFYNKIRELNGDGLRVVGFNVMHFDLPFLYERMKTNRIVTFGNGGHDVLWLYKKLFGCGVDLLQMHLHLNDFVWKGLNHNALCRAYGFSEKGENGKEVADLYYSGRYAEILDYVRREFVYPRIYERILKEGVIRREDLMRSVLNGNGVGSV